MFDRDLGALSTKALHHSNIQQMTVCERVDLLLDILIGHKDLCERLEKGLVQDHNIALDKMLSLKKRKIQGVIRGTDVCNCPCSVVLFDFMLFLCLQAESVEQLEAKVLAQENVISNIELRSDFSLYCVYMETQLVYAYLETMSSILGSLVSLKINSHSDVRNFVIFTWLKNSTPNSYGHI